MKIIVKDSDEYRERLEKLKNDKPLVPKLLEQVGPIEEWGKNPKLQKEAYDYMGLRPIIAFEVIE